MIHDLGALSGAVLWIQVLVFCRIAAIVVLLPGFGDLSLPRPYKLLFSLFLTVAITSYVAQEPVIMMPQNLGVMLWSLLYEIMIGLLIGMSGRILFLALELLGSIYAQQVGFAHAVLFNPFLQHETSPVSTFLMMAATMIILTTDLHYHIFEGIIHSYQMFPVYQKTQGITEISFFILLEAVSSSFCLAVKLAAPILIVGTLFHIALGVLNRLMPQMPIFFVAQPAQILLGLFILFASVHLLINVFLEKYQEYWSRW